jgi:hypothetical protein
LRLNQFGFARQYRTAVVLEDGQCFGSRADLFLKAVVPHLRQSEDLLSDASLRGCRNPSPVRFGRCSHCENDFTAELRISGGQIDIGLTNSGPATVDADISRQGHRQSSFELATFVGLTFLVPGLKDSASDAVSTEDFSAVGQWLNCSDAVPVGFVKAQRSVLGRPFQLGIKRPVSGLNLPLSHFELQSSGANHGEGIQH